MPYASDKQNRFVHAKAAEGVPWAKKFVSDAHGTHVGDPKDVAPKRRLKAKRKAKGRKPDPAEGTRADLAEDRKAGRFK